MAFGDPSIFDIRETYKADTVGRKYHKGIKNKYTRKEVYKSTCMEENSKTFNLDNPIDVSEFNEMSYSTKRDYLTHLREKYNATDGAVAEMLGLSNPKFLYVLNQLDIPSRKKGQKRSEFQKKMWTEFVNKYIITQNSNKSVDVSEQTEPEPNSMKLDSLTMSMFGTYDPNHVIKMLDALTFNKKEDKVRITISVESVED